MGIIKSTFSFMVGTVFGVYLAQNYKVPNVQKLVNTGLLIGKHIEENYRKPKKRDDEETGAIFTAKLRNLSIIARLL